MTQTPTQTSGPTPSRDRPGGLMRFRLLLGAVGVGLGLFGAFRLLTQVPLGDDFVLLIWLVALVAIHDGVLSPLVLGVATVLHRVVPPRALAFVQGGLLVFVSIAVIAVFEILHAGTSPVQKGLLRQNYVANLGIIAGIVAGVTLVLYAVRVAQRRPAPVPEDEPVS